MDLFYDAIPIPNKKRDHFNNFMIGIQEQLHSLRTKGGNIGDPLVYVAESIRRETVLLCLDEFQVTDIGNAMTVLNLFHHLWRLGVVLVSMKGCESVVMTSAHHSRVLCFHSGHNFESTP